LFPVELKIPDHPPSIGGRSTEATRPAAGAPRRRPMQSARLPGTSASHKRRRGRQPSVGKGQRSRAQPRPTGPRCAPSSPRGRGHRRSANPSQTGLPISAQPHGRGPTWPVLVPGWPESPGGIVRGRVRRPPAAQRTARTDVGPDSCGSNSPVGCRGPEPGRITPPSTNSAPPCSWPRTRSPGLDQ